MTESNNYKCPICNSSEYKPFCEILNQPAHVGIQWSTKAEAAECPRGDINLSFCHGCGFIGNPSFEFAPMQYSPDYDNTLHFSPRYRAYARDVAERLVERYDLHEKNIIDVGCGRGDFLKLMCSTGNNRGTGFDMSAEETPTEGEYAGMVRFIRDYYGESYADLPADLIESQYVLEHIPNPNDLVSSVRNTIGDRKGTVVYFEVPNVALILKQLSIWDIIYEHCCYFGSGSFAHVFASNRFRVNDLRDGFDGQFLQIEATPIDEVDLSGIKQWADTDQLSEMVAAFKAEFDKCLDNWQQKLRQLAAINSKVVLWGAGAKGVSFLNMPGFGEQVSYVVDINPRKAGKYMAGTAQQIVEPKFLTEYKPDKVILMNPVYHDEVQATLNELNLTAEILNV